MNIKWLASLAFLILLETSTAESQNVRVKLCGRDFMRMIIEACGSPRVKRSMPDTDLHFTNPFSRFGFFRHSWNLQKWLDRDLVAHQKGSLAVEGEQQRDAPETIRGHLDPRQHTSPPTEPLDHSTTVQDLSMATRSRRDAGPSGICCTSGCTMNELIQFC